MNTKGMIYQLCIMFAAKQMNGGVLTKEELLFYNQTLDTMSSESKLMHINFGEEIRESDNEGFERYKNDYGDESLEA